MRSVTAGRQAVMEKKQRLSAAILNSPAGRGDGWRYYPRALQESTGTRWELEEYAPLLLHLKHFLSLGISSILQAKPP